MHSRLRCLTRLVAPVGLLLQTGCVDDFSPLVQGPADVAVHGFLDASSDTQWIRVTPMRNVVLTSPDPLNVSVMLQEVGGDQRVELQDSLFWFPTGDTAIGAAGMYVHNFWAAARAKPAATYRLLVTRSGHPTAVIPVRMPGDYEVRVWRSSARISPVASYLQVLGAKYVPFLTLTASCAGGGALYDLAPQRLGQDIHQATVPDFFLTCSSGQFTVVGSEQAWPDGQGYSLYRLTAGGGNYSNALGFVGGVIIKVIPYENCELIGGAASDYCVMRYHSASASISGQVSEVRCGNGPIRGAKVELLELDPVPPAKAQRRSTSTGRNANYSISALVPGVRYALRAEFIVDPAVAVYSVHADTLVFQAGERRTYDVGLELMSGCQNQAAEPSGGQR